MTKNSIFSICLVVSNLLTNAACRTASTALDASTLKTKGPDSLPANSLDIGPQAVALVWRGEAFCSGVILDKRTILTAAHCLEQVPIQEIGIYWGPLAPNQPRPLNPAVFVQSIEIHPDYDNKVMPNKNDLAKLHFDMDLPLAETLQLPRLDPQLGPESIKACSLVYSIGYGTGRTDSSPSKRLFPGQILGVLPKEQVAVIAHPANASACKGDSGCPIFLGGRSDQPPMLVGIAGGGFKCDDVQWQYSYFTPLYPYTRWLHEKPGFPTPAGRTLPPVVPNAEISTSILMGQSFSYQAPGRFDRGKNDFPPPRGRVPLNVGCPARKNLLSAPKTPTTVMK